MAPRSSPAPAFSVPWLLCCVASDTNLEWASYVSVWSELCPGLGPEGAPSKLWPEGCPCGSLTLEKEKPPTTQRILGKARVPILRHW